MEAIWFVKIGKVKEGPYTAKDLASDRRVTLNSLVWREGFEYWLPIRDVPELRIYFSEEEETDEEETVKHSLGVGEDLLLEMQNEPPHFLFFFLIAVAIMGFFFLKLFLS